MTPADRRPDPRNMFSVVMLVVAIASWCPNSERVRYRLERMALDTSLSVMDRAFALPPPRSTLKCNTFSSGFLPGRRRMLRIGQVAATVPVS